MISENKKSDSKYFNFFLQTLKSKFLEKYSTFQKMAVLFVVSEILLQMSGPMHGWEVFTMNVTGFLAVPHHMLKYLLSLYLHLVVAVNGVCKIYFFVKLLCFLWRMKLSLYNRVVSALGYSGFKINEKKKSEKSEKENPTPDNQDKDQDNLTIQSNAKAESKYVDGQELTKEEECLELEWKGSEKE